MFQLKIGREEGLQLWVNPGVHTWGLSPSLPFLEALGTAPGKKGSLDSATMYTRPLAGSRTYQIEGGDDKAVLKAINVSCHERAA